MAYFVSHSPYQFKRTEVDAMAYTYRNQPSHSDVFRAIPLHKPASVLRPFDPMPATPIGPYTGPQLPPTEDELRRRDLANAEATLAGLMNALKVARAGIGEANRTHTAPGWMEATC